MARATPIFDPPQTRRMTLTRSIWVKGKGLPKDGKLMFREGEEVTVHTDNGAEWYLMTSLDGKEIRVATILSTL